VDFPLSVEEFVSLGRFAHRGFFGAPGEEDLRRVSEAMELSGLADLSERPLYALSAGERQRACVARAVAQGGAALLLDEPAAFLDLAHRVAFHDLVARLASERGTAVLMASHDLHFSAEYGGRIVLLAGGKVLARGTPEEVLVPSLVEEAYGVAVRCEADPESGAVRVFPRTGRKRA
jgi:iron complex transport system ATP-binding protein